MLRDIPDSEGYQITEDGQVFSLKSGKYLKPKIDRYGYKAVTLFVNGKPKYSTVHRLVALAYLDNPDKLPCVNHIDENKLNNRVENLEWCTVKHNDNHGTRNLRMARTKCKRPVMRRAVDGKITVYNGVKDASRKTGIAHSQIAIHCKNHLPTRDGSKWRYQNEQY